MQSRELKQLLQSVSCLKYFLWVVCVLDSQKSRNSRKQTRTEIQCPSSFHRISDFLRWLRSSGEKAGIWGSDILSFMSEVRLAVKLRKVFWPVTRLTSVSCLDTQPRKKHTHILAVMADGVRASCQGKVMHLRAKLYIIK